MLENEKRPASGKEVIPSIAIIQKAAEGMRIDFDDLFAMMSDEVVSLQDDSFEKFDTSTIVTKAQKELLAITNQLSSEKQDFLLKQAKVLLHSSEEL